MGAGGAGVLLVSSSSTSCRPAMPLLQRAALACAALRLAATHGRTVSHSSSFEPDPAFSAARLAEAPAGWPKPDWSTVPTFTFCGPSSRPFEDHPDELQFFAGTNASRRRPRWCRNPSDPLH